MYLYGFPKGNDFLALGAQERKLRALFDYLVGACKQRRRHVDTERFEAALLGSNNARELLLQPFSLLFNGFDRAWEHQHIRRLGFIRQRARWCDLLLVNHHECPFLVNQAPLGGAGSRCHAPFHC
jgi:hypothetical protein